jgi:hypothetical protein
MALLPTQFLDSVVSIGTIDSGNFKALASGFLLGFKVADADKEGKAPYKIFLITNRHVFSEYKQVILRFNLTQAGSKTYNLNLVDDKNNKQWLAHPNGNVDVAAININANTLKQDGINFDIVKDEDIAFLDTIRNEGISQGDGVFVLGFPMGIAGRERNYAIVRGGIIARLDDEIINSECKFLIDSTVFPGNSGGPVFLKPEIASLAGTKAVDRAYLLGVISSYILYEERAISEQTGKLRIVFVENSGIAAVVPMDFVRETIQPLMDAIKKDQKISPERVKGEEIL